uniref:Choline transporter-like protein n=1 Tax=Cacopsylla melanoneura TaxID=428564 RepID=A0A8D9AGR2_9HEMI
MGGCCSSDSITDDQVDAAKREAGFKGSVKTNSRSCTDRPFLLLLILCLGLLGGLTLYCVKNGDTRRLFNGYDNCGNICGVPNTKEDNPKFACKGVDESDKPFLLLEDAGSLTSPKAGQRHCVKNCSAQPGYFKFINRCLPTEFEHKIDALFNSTSAQEYFQEAVEDVVLVKWQIIKLTAFALVFSLILVFLLRFVAALIIWLVLIGATLASIGLTVFLWITWYGKTNIKDRTQIVQREQDTYFTYAIISTFVALAVLVIVLVMRNRIRLVIRLFTEAGKALADMPLLLVQPLVTFLSLVLVFAGFVYFGILIQGGGFLTVDPNNEKNFYYKKDFAMKFSRIYDLFMWFWMVQFCIGCQHMVIAGSVATWFFTRDKSRVESPISTAVCNLFSCHLGSVSLGSMIIAIVQIIRLILTAMKKAMKDSQNETVKAMYNCCQCCFSALETILQYLTRNAYIEVAMFGTSFCQGGAQAFKLLTSNALRVAAINSVGDFVLFLAKVLVVACSVFLGFYLIDPIPGVQHLGVPLTIIGLVSYFIAHCFFTVYEMVIDTIFLCFCEDCEINDGESKPYFMSAGLMEFVDDSNRELRVGDAHA